MTKIDGFLLTCVSPKRTHLPVLFWVESKGINYGRKHNPYKILVQNGYDRKRIYLDKAIWVSVDKNKPKILKPRRLNISKEDLNKVFEYIKVHFEDFDNHIKYDDDDFSIHTRLYGTKEEKENLEYDLLFWLRDENTKLGADLYLQTKELQQRSRYEERFNKPNIFVEPKYSWYFYLTIEDSPKYLDEEDNDIEYRAWDKEIVENNIKQFIKQNKNILLSFYNGEIDINDCLNKLNFNIDKKYCLQNNNKDGINGISRIGITNDNYEIFVCTDDLGKSPHFHYRRKDDLKRHTAIYLNKPQYFQHMKRQAILNKKQKIDLVNFLNSKPTRITNYKTNWECLLDSWNANNDNEISINLQIPDYTKLK